MRQRRRLHYLRHLLPPIAEAPEGARFALRLRTPVRWDAALPKYVRKAPRRGLFATARKRLQGRLGYTREFFPKANYGVPPSLINALDFLASEWPTRRQAS
jgi:hypothetical protein